MNTVNQAFIIIIAYRLRRRRKKPGIGRYPMGPTNINKNNDKGAIKINFILFTAVLGLAFTVTIGIVGFVGR